MTALIVWTLGVSVVLALALAAVALASSGSAALKHWVLAGAVLCAATVPVAERLVPAWMVPSLVWATSQDSQALRAAVGGREEGPVRPQPSAAAFEGNRTGLTRVLGVMWAMGAASLLAWILLGVGRLRRIARQARPAEARWTLLAAEVSAAIGLERPVRILQSDEPSRLFAWGLVRPAVIVPSGAESWSDERTRLVLCHELSHIARADTSIYLIAGLLRCVFWFNPLVWVVCRRLRQESERACDDAVLRHGVHPTEYASELLSLARAMKEPRLAHVPAPAMAQPSGLAGRIAVLLVDGVDRRPVAPRVRRVSALAAAILGVALGSVAASARGTGSLAGRVTDQTGRTVAQAVITLLNRDTGARVRTSTDREGAYTFVGIAPGRYGLQTSRTGFRTAASAVVVEGGRAEQHVVLEIGSLEESIRVVHRTVARESKSAPRAAVMRRQAVSAVACGDSAAGGQIAQPRKISDVRPRYPALYSASGVETVVVLDAVVGTDGFVRNVRAAEPTTQPDFLAAAIQAVQQWQFTPTLLNCVPVEASMKVTTRFSVR